jgi:hypothetical protein
MRLIRRWFALLGVMVFLFFAANYSWTHAAIAAAVAPGDCRDGLEHEARQSLEGLYGEAQARPMILCFSRPVAGLKVSHGTTLFAPFMTPIIVLGPKGQNVNVAAHELAHAELSARTSVMLRSYRLPTWFDEGLAMQFDHRPNYSKAALARMLEAQIDPDMRLDQIDRPSKFYQPSPLGAAHYAFAKCAVGNWLMEASKEGLHDLIAGISWTKPFPHDHFKQHEQSCLRQAPS